MWMDVRVLNKHVSGRKAVLNVLNLETGGLVYVFKISADLFGAAIQFTRCSCWTGCCHRWNVCDTCDVQLCFIDCVTDCHQPSCLSPTDMEQKVLPKKKNY